MSLPAIPDGSGPPTCSPDLARQWPAFVFGLSADAGCPVLRAAIFTSAVDWILMNGFGTAAGGALASPAARSRVGGPVGFELLRAAIDRFLPAPAWSASYDTDVDAAADWLCTDPAFLVRLAEEHGLPHVSDPVRGPLFERADLANSRCCRAVSAPRWNGRCASSWASARGRPPGGWSRGSGW
ncbi:hypothetical protein [Kitasatospora griseola]|uniref:hypothetical protein n=1 Tax=Kitasatospora griseola TaxID=2064 RepID=UPI00166FB6BA|nr:hypothetical protein [Kitasatospora griseola]GGQ78005.1 hypothetical protein GCM10010195_36940 [Kitasatospora griseola]